MATMIGGCIDVETTGLIPQRDEIVELALLLFAYNRKADEVSGVMDWYAGLREPNCPISRGASMVHGITKHELRGTNIDNARVLSLLEQTDFLVSHNAVFDRSFTTPLFPEAAEKPWYCSMNGISWWRKGFKSKGLQNLLTVHGIEVVRSHRALDDARAVVELLGKRNTGGKTYLSELLASGILGGNVFQNFPARSER